MYRQRKFWIYGGANNGMNQDTYNALWQYDPTTNNWTWVWGISTPNQFPVWGTQGIPAVSNTPGNRGWGTITWTDTQGNLWLFGGGPGANGPWADLWKYDISSNI